MSENSLAIPVDAASESVSVFYMHRLGTSTRLTSQRAAVIRCIERRAALGLTTCAADVTRAVWGRPGHAATYAVIARMARAGMVRRRRNGSALLLTLVA